MQISSKKIIVRVIQPKKVKTETNLNKIKTRKAPTKNDNEQNYEKKEKILNTDQEEKVSK